MAERPVISFSAVLFLVTACVSGNAQGRSLDPIDSLQQEIDKAVLEIAQPTEEAAGDRETWKTSKVVIETLSRLMKAADHDRIKIFQQLIYYMRHNASTEQRTYGSIGILDLLDFSPEDVISGSIPFLNTEDVELKNLLYSALTEAALSKDDEGGDVVGFEAFTDYMKKNGFRLSTELLNYMFERFPGQALKPLLDLHAGDLVAESHVHRSASIVSDLMSKHRWGKPWSEDEIQTMAKELDSLSRAHDWWVRLFVAHIICKKPTLSDEETTARLSTDAEPVVRKVMRSVRNEN